MVNIELVPTSTGESASVYICQLKSVIGEWIWDLLLTSTFLPRWKEASGVDSACASCESSKIESSGTSSVGSTNSWVTGGGSSGLSTPGRKIRDVAQSESMLYKK